MSHFGGIVMIGISAMMGAAQVRASFYCVIAAGCLGMGSTNF
jgi:hypothetical protein